MKLYAMQSKLLVADAHHFSSATYGGYFQRAAHTFAFHHPAMVSTHQYFCGQSLKDWVVTKVQTSG